ncbi:hypothetical protein H9Y04_12000 [Streptomyces sp. TRM66268-LWL]|uniref:DNA-binding protein n=1 Tax=Streptomyces polyasparticus TaxID=2767826 RepID=A0ABR7SFP2_9ACTN|nr:hypothetical protein [Streptomyces polyasparticus]MBC9713291.1 hypothetical protein [Streptomyces polyasparticus]
MTTPYDDDTAAALLEAGAVLPAGTTVREDADALTARTYTHPALEDRRIVRLVPQTLGEAEDLALEFLGLERAPGTPEVGQVRRETLGFPAWALVNDPANGHHALALVKDMERLSRQAKSRPGTAKEGFEELGERLGRAVPHFLPTFYEQAARTFLQHDNTTYAAAFFGKAREAERVHALAVDEERRRAVFLEFAFAGALTVKALKEHVRDLSQRLAPVEAWAQFRQLTVERCAAGMPPHASLPQDARGLIKAAGLARVTEECALVADLISSPAAVRAPASFWTAYRATLKVLTEERPALRVRLLEIMPTGLGRSSEDDVLWLTLLAECGADRLLTGEDEAGDGVDAADWLSRWAMHRKRGGAADRCAATLALVERMAPRLREAGRAVDLFADRWHARVDVDLLDLCVAEGVPVSFPGADVPVHVPLDQWLRSTAPGRRDLAASAADARCRPLLYAAVGALGRGAAGLHEQLAAHPVLSGLLREWLDDAVADLGKAAGLPGAQAAFNRLSPFRSVAAQVSPQAVAGVAACPIAPLLGRTLRAGIMDELGWPALDEGLRLLDADTARGKDDELTVAEAWPALILARGHKVIVVGPEKVLLEHDLRIPHTLERWQRPDFRFTDGELLVIWRHENKQYGYWSARPSEVFTLGGDELARWYSSQEAGTPSIPLPGGGRATGGRVLHAGDTVLPPSRPVIGDGTAYWRQGRQGLRQIWLEYDPATGTHGRASLPALLQSGIQEDATLLQQHCEVLPLQPGLEQSPFGTDGTVLGRWVRRQGEGAEARMTAGTPDGRTVTWQGTYGIPLGALKMPGGAAPVAVQTAQTITLCAPDDPSVTGELSQVTLGSRGSAFAAGTRFLPAPAFWHALRPRDEQSSAVLRALTDEQTDELLAAAVEALAELRDRRAELQAGSAESGGTADTTGLPTAEDVLLRTVAQALPALTEERLLAGVTALVAATVRFATAANAFAHPPAPQARPQRNRTEGMFADYRPEHGDDATLILATRGISGAWGWWTNSAAWQTLRQIRAVSHVLSGRPADGTPLHERLTAPVGAWRSDEHTIPVRAPDWTQALGVLRPLAYRAASPALPEDRREALLLLFEALAEGPLAAAEGTLRTVVLCEEQHGQDRAGQVLRHGDRTVVVIGGKNVDYQRKRLTWLALDHDPTGEFGAVAHFTLEREKVFTSAFPAGGLAEVARLIRDKGAVPWRPEAPATLTTATREGLGPLQAAALLAAQPEEPGADVLALIGLKTRQLELGNNLLMSLGATHRLALMSALLPGTPADLWTAGPDLAAAAQVWDERLGSLVRLPEDIVADLAGLPGGSSTDVLNPGLTPWISRTTVQRLDKEGRLVADDPRAVPSRHMVANAVDTLASLAYTLPIAHPLRAGLPDSLAAIRRRLTDPGLLLDLDISWTHNGGSTAEQLRTAHGLAATGGAEADGFTPVGDVFLLYPGHGNTEAVLVRPAALTGPDDPSFGLVEGLVGSGRGTGMRALRTLLDDGITRALAVTGTAGHAQDAAVSAPALVAEVAAAHELSEDAAVLYLQLLALPDPTDRNCARWTGWKPARMKKARTELAATSLVVEAKRPRAGRTLFLPCGWRDLKAPALPVETWKEGLYPVPGHARAVPLMPVAELFARAWQRVRDGDAPAYEELTTRATRKGRRR